MSDHGATDRVGAPTRKNAAAGDDTGIGKCWMVKKTKKGGRGNKPTTSTASSISTSANKPPAHHLTISHPPTELNHQAQQPTTTVLIPPLSQITASRLGLEILNNNALVKDQASAPTVDATGTQSSKGAGGAKVGAKNRKQKEDWLRPDTVTSTAEDDRLVTTQTRLLKRRFDTMREDAEEGDSVNAKKQRVAGDGGGQKPSFSVQEALAMGRPGSTRAYLKERLEWNLLEREELLRRCGESG